MITFAALNRLDKVRHAFFTREGGVSEGLFGSLNCGFGSGDGAANITRNRQIAMEMMELPPTALVTARQNHTVEVALVDAALNEGTAPAADGLVTKTPGIALGILTADCAPVLIADANAGVIGAAHAGWRGALDGIVEAVIEKMTDLGAQPSEMVAVIGPCIAQRSYEVGREFSARFLGNDGGNETFFAPARQAGHFMFDLSGYVARRLAAAGLAKVVCSPGDTCEEADRFFSYRRAVLKGEQDYGRCLATIALEA